MQHSTSTFRLLLIDDGTAGKLGTWHSQKPTPIYGSGACDGPCLPVFISCLCIQLLFLPLGHKNINFKSVAAASFLQLAGGGGAGRSVHHRDRFRQGVPAERDIPLLVFGGQSPNRQCQTWYSEPTGPSRAFCSYCR